MIITKHIIAAKKIGLEVRQGPAGILKNGSIVGMSFHDCKRGLDGIKKLVREELGRVEIMVKGGT